MAYAGTLGPETRHLNSSRIFQAAPKSCGRHLNRFVGSDYRHFHSRSSKTRNTGRVYANENYNGVHHVGLLCKDISDSLRFYKDVLGMEINEARPDDKLPYKGAWLWVGDEMIHLMELPNPDPADGRPEHGGRDRHVCLSVKSIEPLESTLKQHGVTYTKSKSGRAALFFRDPDQNVLEMAEQ